jgi:hypothetical protein
MRSKFWQQSTKWGQKHFEGPRKIYFETLSDLAQEKGEVYANMEEIFS